MIKCDYPECTDVSVNSCHDCDVVMCAEHSYNVLTDEGKDVFVCPGCFFDGGYSDHGTFTFAEGESNE